MTDQIIPAHRVRAASNVVGGSHVAPEPGSAPGSAPGPAPATSATVKSGKSKAAPAAADAATVNQEG